LPFAALIGFLWFGEVTDLWTWAGAAIIAGSAIYVAHREAQLSRLNRAALAARPAAPHPEDADAPAAHTPAGPREPPGR